MPSVVILTPSQEVPGDIAQSTEAHVPTSRKLSRLGVVALAAGPPIVGGAVVAMTTPAGATWSGQVWGTETNGTKAGLFDQAAMPASQDALCGDAKNYNNTGFTAHLEYLNNGSHYANSGEFSLPASSTSGSYCVTGVNFSQSQSVILWKDSGSNHTNMSSVTVN